VCAATAHRLASAVAAMTVSLGGLDTLAFTGFIASREDLQIAAGVEQILSTADRV
jgi:hypothetical protein